MIEMGRLDLGAEEKTANPCIARTWCVLDRDHDGSCEEVPRGELPRTDHGASYRKGNNA